MKTKRIVPKVISCLRYCFLPTKDCMHNEVWGCAETLPFLVVQMHFMALMVCLRAFASSSLCTEACIFAKYLSFYDHPRAEILTIVASCFKSLWFCSGSWTSVRSSRFSPLLDGRTCHISKA